MDDISGRSFIDFITKTLKIESKRNKYFFYPILSETGFLSLKIISECLIGYEVTPEFSRIPFGLSVKSNLDHGPHNNRYNTPSSFLMHDSSHISGILENLDFIDFHIYRDIYSKVLRYNSEYKTFLVRIFYFICWYTLFEHQHHKLNELLNNEISFIYIDEHDSKYIVDFLKQNAPDEIKEFKINFDSDLVMIEISNFYKKCINYLTEKIPQK